jgi:hypothetical protein
MHLLHSLTHIAAYAWSTGLAVLSYRGVWSEPCEERRQRSAAGPLQHGCFVETAGEIHTTWQHQLKLYFCHT